MNIKFVYTIISIVLFQHSLLGQNNSIDSLKNELLIQNEDVIKTTIHLKLVNLYYLNRDLENAKIHAEAAKKISSKTQDNEQLFLAYQNLIILSIDSKNLTKALNYCFEASRNIPKKNAVENKAYILNECSMVYSLIGDLDQSIIYGDSAVNIAKTHQLYLLPVYLSNLGNIYHEKGFNMKGITLIKESLIANNNLVMKTISQLKISEIYFDINHLDSSKYYLKEIDKNFQNIQNQPEYVILKMMSFKLKARIALKSEKHERCLMFSDSLFTLAKETQNIKLLQEALKLKITLFKNKDNAEKALFYSEKLNLLTDSIQNIDISDIKKIKDHALSLLDEKQSLSDSNFSYKLQRRKMIRNLTYLVIMVILLIFVTITLYLFHLKKILKSNDILDKLETENSKSKLELDRLKSNLSNDIIKVNVVDKVIKIVERQLEKSKEEVDIHTYERIAKLIQRIKLKTEDSGVKDYEKKFTHIQKDFFVKLVKEFPNLTPNEKKLCGFLKLNMSSKEISEITGQSDNSIIKARSRLRKKFGISSSKIGLSEFIEKYN